MKCLPSRRISASPLTSPLTANSKITIPHRTSNERLRYMPRSGNGWSLFFRRLKMCAHWESDGKSFPWPQVDMQTDKQAPDSQPVCSVSHYFFFFTPSFGQIHILVAVNAYLIRLKSDRKGGRGGGKGRGERNYNIDRSRANDFCLWTAATTSFITKKNILTVGCLQKLHSYWSNSLWEKSNIDQVS